MKMPAPPPPPAAPKLPKVAAPKLTSKQWAIIITILVIIGLLGGVAGLGYYTVTRSFPTVAGTLKVAGLQAQVDVYRTAEGIPHIYADNPHDLFFAQGYIHAQDRFYQMDFWRHLTSGRLSELYGAGQLETDKFLRTVGWDRVAAEEYAALDDDSKAVLEAYADGVNAYLTGRATADISLEYSVLALNGLGSYQPEPWTPVHTLAWVKSMAWDLGGNMDEEIRRVVLLQTVGAKMTGEYMPLYPEDHPVIVTSPGTSGGEFINSPHAANYEEALNSINWQQLDAALDATNMLRSPTAEGIGSNSWVIAGSRTTTGKPLLANDPHLSIQMPSIWYEIGLHCKTASEACAYDVVGFSFAGAPGIIMGHNARIAWGMTNLGPDVQDLYIEKLNPANPNQYEVNGEWVDMDIVPQTIKIKGEADQTINVRYTRHGPIVSDTYLRAREDLTGTVNGVRLNENYAVALRWTALEPIFTFRALLRLNYAQNFEDFRAALEDFAAPSQNFVYADIDGNIGYQAPGHVPIRANGYGLLPAPGWTDDYEWKGYIPFDELPYSYNPPEGYIATANNAVVGADYEYNLTYEWDAGYRAARIVTMLEAQPKADIAYIQAMHGDNANLGAAEILPYLMGVTFTDTKLIQGQDLLRTWDMQMGTDSAPAALYAGFLRALVMNTFQDEMQALPRRYWPTGGANNWLTLRLVLAEPTNRWWDDVNTANAEDRDAILAKAFEAGYADVVTRLGADTSQWKWGNLHTSTFANATLGSSGSPEPIRAIFNRGPFATSGGGSIVNATNWRANSDAPNPYVVTNVPSMRMIVDLGDFNNSVTIHPTGQSGHAYHTHYIDFAEAWRTIAYHPMQWDPAKITATPEGYLILQP